MIVKEEYFVVGWLHLVAAAVSRHGNFLREPLCPQFLSFSLLSMFKLWDYLVFKLSGELFGQTWNLSKILHRRIFRLKILHLNFTKF